MDNITLARLGFFFGAFIIFALLEAKYAYNERTQVRGQRWLSNLGLSIISMAVLRVFAFLGLITFADATNHNSLLSAVPLWLGIVLTIIVFDFLIYAQHVITHHVPLLWRLHKVHHADRDLDVSSGIRFHPLEIMFSYFYKLVFVFILGPPVIALIIFEIILNASAMFNHSNFALPKKWDKLISRVIVTPTMHRVHHSIDLRESNRNFGFFFSFWDKLFNTYVEKNNKEITLGLVEHQSGEPNKLGWSLLLPFKPRK